jgi:Glycine zipper 2TM domain
MFAKRTITAFAAGTLLAASLPAFAESDRGDREPARRYEHSRSVDYGYPRAREVVIERHVDRRVARRPVYVERAVYPTRPAPVYHPRVYEPAPVYHPPVYEPAPVHYPHGHERARGPNVLGTAAGAIVGAAIGSQVGHGPNRAATTAVGAVIGGVIGSQF